MILHRRELFRLGAGTAVAAGSSRVWAQAMPDTHPAAPTAPPAGASPPADAGKADYTLRIAVGIAELAPEVAISTKLYNGQFPGPLLRFQEGKPVVVDVHNDTDSPEQLHWHGQFLPADVDGSTEEGTPVIPAHGMRRIAFTPGPSGARWYHSHGFAGFDLTAGPYSGQAGPVYIEPRHEQGAFDREIFLTLKEFAPFLSRTEMPSEVLAVTTQVPELKQMSQAAAKAALDAGLKQGYELGYNYYTINGKMLGQGDPIQVKPGERVLFHVLNASASEIRSLYLPGHVFKVVALDGNPVPKPAEVPVLWLGTAERVSAIVEMKQPGVWVLGDLNNDDRGRGMGIVVEYAGRSGKAVWKAPKTSLWDYRRFAADKPSRQPDETIEMLITTRVGVRNGFDEFLINGVAFSMDKMEAAFHLKNGRRYRLHFRNATDDIHPLHLHRNSFEITSIAGMPTGGVIKDTAMIGGFQEMTVDFTADQPGLSLFHCHMQQHMDFGFMALFDCA
jgi:FtsP/CotA-like multicopper oxidase with cupredoxin domain